MILCCCLRVRSAVLLICLSVCFSVFCLCSDAQQRAGYKNAILERKLTALTETATTRVRLSDSLSVVLSSLRVSFFLSLCTFSLLTRLCVCGVCVCCLVLLCLQEVQLNRVLAESNLDRICWVCHHETGNGMLCVCCCYCCCCCFCCCFVVVVVVVVVAQLLLCVAIACVDFVCLF